MWTQIAGEHADLLSPFRHHVSNSEYHEDFLKQAFFSLDTTFKQKPQSCSLLNWGTPSCLLNRLMKVNKEQTLPSDRLDRWHHMWIPEASRWLGTWPALESDPGSLLTWWLSRWKQEVGWLLLPGQQRKRGFSLVNLGYYTPRQV